MKNFSIALLLVFSLAQVAQGQTQASSQNQPPPVFDQNCIVLGICQLDGDPLYLDPDASPDDTLTAPDMSDTSDPYGSEGDDPILRPYGVIEPLPRKPMPGNGTPGPR